MSGVLLKPRFQNRPVFYKAEAVGSIGDVIQMVKLKHSMPDLPLRYDPTFATARVGQNVQDGNSPSYSTHAYGPSVVVSAFDRESNNTKAGGFTHQDIIPEDKLVIADTIALPSYSWENLKAETYKAQVSGQQFLPLPGGFAPLPGSVPRGGAVPQSYGGMGDTFTPLGGGGITATPNYYDRPAETNYGKEGGIYGLPREPGGMARGLMANDPSSGIANLRDAALNRQRQQNGFAQYA